MMLRLKKRENKKHRIIIIGEQIDGSSLLQSAV